MIVPHTGASPLYDRPTFEPSGSLPYEAELHGARHRRAIDPQGTVYTPGLGDISGFSFGAARKPSIYEPKQSGIVVPAVSRSTVTKGAMATAMSRVATPASRVGFQIRAPVLSKLQLGRAAVASSSKRFNMRGLGDIGELAGATGITAIDSVIVDLGEKAKRIESALKLTVAASITSAVLVGLSLFVGSRR